MKFFDLFPFKPYTKNIKNSQMIYTLNVARVLKRKKKPKKIEEHG